MIHRLILHNAAIAARAKAIIDALPHDTVHEVIIRPHKSKRSLDQNALLWQWLTIIGSDLGYTKEEAHEEYKRRFLVPILIRDDAEYAAMWRTIEEVGQQPGMEKDSKCLAIQVTALTSTTRLNTKQMTEYLTDIDRHAAGLGIYLPHPEDRRV